MDKHVVAIFEERQSNFHQRTTSWDILSSHSFESFENSSVDLIIPI